MDTFFIFVCICFIALDIAASRRAIEKRLESIQKDLAEIREAITPTEWKS